MRYLGNKQILNNPMTAFFCSDKYSSKSVLACYDWATEMKKAGRIVISGFQSRLEKDVLEILIKGSQPVVMALARGIYKSCPIQYADAVREGRMLILSQFEDELTVVTKEQAYARNIKVIELATDVVIGHINEGGMLEAIAKTIEKPLTILDKVR